MFRTRNTKKQTLAYYLSHGMTFFDWMEGEHNSLLIAALMIFLGVLGFVMAVLWFECLI